MVATWAAESMLWIHAFSPFRGPFPGPWRRFEGVCGIDTPFCPSRPLYGPENGVCDLWKNYTISIHPPLLGGKGFAP